ncbi:uncharacterized protein LOC141641379 [Silene latifolia]|uniref:uncharacterized protein LOC141641379 n=1 Tax=Silene latifolia TaxID=37657 RepID=UPI003D78092C
MKGGSRPQRQMKNFQKAVDGCGLRNVAWEGYQFTFDNGQSGEANRQSMIDRAMCTAAWTDMFPYAKLIHLNQEWSDHAPIKLLFDKREKGQVMRNRFCFEQVWVGEVGCEEAMVRGFEKGRGDLVDSLKACTSEL